MSVKHLTQSQTKFSCQEPTQTLASSMIFLTALLRVLGTASAWLRPDTFSQQAITYLTFQSPPRANSWGDLPPGLDLLDTSIGEITALLDAGNLTSETLVAAYLRESTGHTPDSARRTQQSSDKSLTLENIEADNHQGLHLRAAIDVAHREQGDLITGCQVMRCMFTNSQCWRLRGGSTTSGKMVGSAQDYTACLCWSSESSIFPQIQCDCAERPGTHSARIKSSACALLRAPLPFVRYLPRPATRSAVGDWHSID